MIRWIPAPASNPLPHWVGRVLTQGFDTLARVLRFGRH